MIPTRTRINPAPVFAFAIVFAALLAFPTHSAWALTAPLTATAVQTSAASTGGDIGGTERIYWGLPAWIEYQVDFGSGGSWVFSLTAINWNSSSAPNLPAGYNFNIDLNIDGVYKNTFSVQGSTTQYKTGSSSAVTVASGVHTVRFTWTNDAYSAGQYDANIQIQSIAIAQQGDTTPPTISSISSASITSTGATITWTTNETATSQVEYGTTTSYGQSTTFDSTLVTSHSVNLTGLTAGTLYHYRVKSKDAASNLATGSDFTFTTAAPPDTTPPTISSISSSSITTNSAVITWTTDEAATSQVDYGPTTSYGQSTTLDTTLLTGHSVALANLTSGSLYHYRVRSKDAAGNERLGSDGAFMTSPTAQTLSFTPEADTYLDVKTPNNNYASATALRIFHVGSNQEGSWGANTFMRFNITGLPAGVTVNSVKLIVVCQNASVESGGTIWTFTPTDPNWSETQPTWNSPLSGTTGTSLFTLGPTVVGQTYEFTGLSSAITGNGRVTFKFTSTSDDGVWYYSKEDANSARRPQLQVTYIASSVVAAPTLSPAGGVVSSSTSVTLATATQGAQIRYTIDGTTPTKLSTRYTTPFSVSAGTTVKARAFLSGMTDSATAIASFASAPGSFSLVSPASGLFIEKDAVVYLQSAGGDPTKTPYEYQFLVDGQVKQAWSASGPATWTPTIAELGTRTLGMQIRNTAQGYNPSQATRDIFVIRTPAEEAEVQQ